jgi:hypothetical protein
VIVDAHAARPLAQGLVGSPQQQQQLHMQVERPIDIDPFVPPFRLGVKAWLGFGIARPA